MMMMMVYRRKNSRGKKKRLNVKTHISMYIMPVLRSHHLLLFLFLTFFHFTYLHQILEQKKKPTTTREDPYKYVV